MRRYLKRSRSDTLASSPLTCSVDVLANVMLLVLVSDRWCDSERVGGDEAPFLSPDVPLDSHVKGDVSLRVGGAAFSGTGGCFGGGGGGGKLLFWKVLFEKP